MRMSAILGVISVIIGVLGYIPYFLDVQSGNTKPHAFTWFIWAFLTLVAFVAQVQQGGGAGSWALGFTALASLIFMAYGIKHAKQTIATVDWVFFILALVALALWPLTQSPLWSVVMITVIDILAFVPTFRKSYEHPYEETLLTYAASAIKLGISLFALETFNLTTALYPASLVVTNTLFIVLVHRWRKLEK